MFESFDLIETYLGNFNPVSVPMLDEYAKLDKKKVTKIQIIFIKLPKIIK